VAWFGIGVVLAAPALAQVERSGGGPNAQVLQQYQQAMSQSTQLQADNSKLKRDLDQAQQQLKSAQLELATLKAGAGSAQSQLTALNAAHQGAMKELEQSKAKMLELIARFRETTTSLRDVEGERSQLQAQLQQHRTALNECADRNVQLAKLNAEVMDRYLHQGLFAHLRDAEPFTQLEKTRNDNLALEDRERLEQLHVQRPAPPAAADSGTTGAQAPPTGTAP
jgi:chromosome segregation ATPase